MNTFDQFQNKIISKIDTDIWPELGPDFVINEFFRQFNGSEGWLGESYFVIWSREEIVTLRQIILQTYPSKYHFFASDGGGTQFGFTVQVDKIEFCSAPNIGSEEDIKVHGDWESFLSAILNNNYI